MAGEFSGHRQTVLFREGLSGEVRCRLMSRMLDRLEEYALLKGRAICFTGIPQDDGEMAAVFASRGYLRSPELPVCYLDIRWQSFSEYLRWLRKRHPRTEKNIHYELSRTRRSGITIQRMDDPAFDSGRLHALADAHYLRLNGRPFPFQPRFFELLKARMGSRAIVSTAEKDGMLIAVQVRLTADGIATVPIIGIDTDHAHKDALYFNLGYNATIEAVIEEGLRQVRFGRLVYDTKIRRGCCLSLSNLYLRPANAFRRTVMRPLIMARTWRMGRMLRPIMEQAASVAACPDDEGAQG
ncbi:MAG: GNAT family N-acetyltransferase [Geobacteraceae bacterium]|nr:GNAT family N-acetyltransferase [Geobacteraceae bacterium]